MKRTPVDSSVLASAGYDQVAAVLELEFISGSVYRYAEVPERVYRELLAAESKGEYFREHIEDRYLYARVSPPRRRPRWRPWRPRRR
jgi:hypothetical protein